MILRQDLHISPAIFTTLGDLHSYESVHCLLVSSASQDKVQRGVCLSQLMFSPDNCLGFSFIAVFSFFLLKPANP